MGFPRRSNAPAFSRVVQLATRDSLTRHARNVPPPANQTPAQQMTRILGFMTRSCGPDNWIMNPGICNSLTGTLERAAEAIAEGNMTRARPHLTAFLAELEAQHDTRPGTHVTHIAYALLRPNVTYLMR